MTDTPSSGRGLTAWRAKQIEGCVAESLASTIRVQDLARSVRLSPGHFSRGFKARFGATPRAWIIQQRLRQAQAMMLESQHSLSQIALDCGFSDQAHFSRMFRRKTGATPGAWRRARREER